MDVSGGRDDNSTPDGIDNSPVGPIGVIDSGGLVTFAGQANFAVTKNRRFVQGSMQALTSRLNAIDDYLTTLSGSAMAGTNLGRRASVSLGGHVVSQPTVFLNQVTVAPDGAALVPGPTQALTSETVTAGSLNGSLTYAWSVRHSTSANVSQFRQRPQSTAGLSAASSGVTVNHDWRTSRRITTNLSFGYNSTTQDISPVIEQSVDTQTARIGIRYDRALSPRRSVGIGIGAGVTRGDTLGFDGASQFTAPTGQISANATLFRSWSATATIQRSVMVLPGVTTDPFLSTTTDVGISGSLHQRVRLSVNGARADGRSRLLGRNAFEASNAIARLDVALIKSTGVFVSYGVFEHRLDGAAIIPAGVPGRYRRNSVRFGLSTSLQVFGPRQTR